MKKLFISLLAIAAAVNAMAIDYTAKAKITLNSQNGESCYFTIGESSDPEALDNIAPMNMTGRVVAMYAAANDKKYQFFFANDIEGLALGLLTNEEVNYTVTFSNVIGKLYLVDGDKFIEITEGGSYAFTAEANQTIADRFSISKYPPYTFIGDVLTIGELKDGTVINMQYFTYVDGKRVNSEFSGTSSNKSVKLFTTEGYCEISYTNKAGVARKFIVNPAPVVTPAN